MGGILGRAVGWNMVVALGYPGAYAVLIILIVLVLAFALLRPGPGLGYVAALGRFVIEGARSIRRLAVAAAVRLEARLRTLEGAAGKSANASPSRKRDTANEAAAGKWQQAPLIKGQIASGPVRGRRAGSRGGRIRSGKCRWLAAARA